MMETKQCSQCNKVKLLSEFHKRGDRTIGVQSHCKECQKVRKKKYLLTENGKTKTSTQSKKHYWTNREKALAENKTWREINKEERSIYSKEYEATRKPEKYLYNKDWTEKNREQVNERQRKKYTENERHKLACKMSSCVYRSLKENKKGRHWEDLVGYKINDLIKRLKATLPEDYTWDNYITGGDLHIDHIIPIDAHNFKSFDDTDFKRCWALKNLQLLPARENLSKSNKIIHHFQPSLSGI